MFDHLNILICFLLILPSLVTSHAGHTQVAIGSRSPTYKVKCDPLSIAASDAFKQDCRDLIQQRAIDGPGPFKGTKTWKEEIWTSTNSIWTTSSRLCAISFSASRPISPQTWIAIEDGIKAIANECIDEKGLGGVLSQTAVHGKMHLPESVIVWITQPYQSLHWIRMASPPETPKRSPPGTCFQLLSSSSQRLTESERKIRTGCYQLMGATGALAASLYTGISNPLLGGGFALGGLVLAHQGTGNLDAGLKGSGHREKLRRSQEGVRMPGISSAPPSLHGPPSPPSPHSPHRPSSLPSMPSSPQHGANERFEVSSSQGDAELRRRCSLWSSFTEVEKHHMQRICCKLSAGACLFAVGGGVSAVSHTMAGVPFAIGGLAASFSAIQEFEGAGISQPRPSRAPTLPVKRRRGLVGRRMAEDKRKLEDKTKEGADKGKMVEGKNKKVEDKRKHLEAGGDMGLPTEAEGGEADGGDEGGGGDGGE